MSVIADNLKSGWTWLFSPFVSIVPGGKVLEACDWLNKPRPVVVNCITVSLKF